MRVCAREGFAYKSVNSVLLAITVTGLRLFPYTFHLSREVLYSFEVLPCLNSELLWHSCVSVVWALGDPYLKMKRFSINSSFSNNFPGQRSVSGEPEPYKESMWWNLISKIRRFWTPWCPVFAVSSWSSREPCYPLLATSSVDVFSVMNVCLRFEKKQKKNHACKSSR
jgi:hypothetical protein